MSERLIEIVGSGFVIFVAGFVVWPPSDAFWQWWTVFSDGQGAALVRLVAMTVLPVILGYAISAIGGVQFTNITIGGGLAFVIGMLLIAFSLSPDSPSHHLLYGCFLVITLLGAAVGNRVTTDREAQSKNQSGSI